MSNAAFSYIVGVHLSEKARSLFLSVKIDLTTDSRTEYDSLPEKTGCHFFLGHFSTLAGDSKFKFFEILKSNITHEILL